MKKGLANWKMQNASLRWSRGNFDVNVEAMEKDVGVAFTAVAGAAQQNVSYVAHSVEVEFFEQRERLTEQAG